MKTRVDLNMTTGYHVLNSGSAVNLFLSRSLEKKTKQNKTKKKQEKKIKHRMQQQQGESLLYGCEITFECFEKTFAHNSKVALQDFCCLGKEI